MRKLILAISIMLCIVSLLSYSQTNITGYIQDGRIAYTDSLTSPGNFTTLRVNAYSALTPTMEELAFQFVVSADTVSSVNVKVETSLDGTSWTNISETGATTAIDSSAAHTIVYTRLRSVYYIRGVFVSETGGTDGKVVVKVKGG